MKKIANGFTIVELLIVIVVIAILAAISVVAYSGIQARAENMKTVVAVSEYAKGLQIYLADEGRYPIASWSCLGKYPDTICAKAAIGSTTCNGNGSVSSTNTFNTEMNKVFNGKIPQPSTQWVSCGGTSYGGAYYYSADGINADVRYLLKGSQPCDGVGGVINYSRYQNGDATLCAGNLPTP